ncbi:hypothetical protein ARMGADRAFT_775363 [Armillaria gallica]|uniref:Uncharacterized protein n=1 Tax=Armillaria gallica TaxID=47427 RepID=A0A2H3CT90_ARMGA|nr:hypothetical protein ARMGADRAFT_775363 [Armillaria gallica]
MSVSSSEESLLDPAAELASRVRESAGVVMAMPIMGSVSPALLPSSLSVSSTASTPPPSTPPTSQAGPFHTTVVPSSATAPSTILMSSWPTTSHTTIERRYCTNLNARIQSLRMAVPALQVSESNDGPKKSKGQRPRSEMKKTRQRSSTSEETLMEEVRQSQRPWKGRRVHSSA